MIFLLLGRFTFRHWRRAPGATLLLVLTLALGVAVYLSIRIANKAAMDGFTNFAELVTTQSDFIVQANAGKLPDAALIELRKELAAYEVDLVPVVETGAARPVQKEAEVSLRSASSLTLIGLDLVALQNFRASRGGESSASEDAARVNNVLDFLGQKEAILINSALAEKEKLQVGDALPLVIEDRLVTFKIAGILADRKGQTQMPETLLLMDLPALQSLTSRGRYLDRIEVFIENGSLGKLQREQIKRVLEKVSDGRWEVLTPEDRREAASVMTQAFRWNLGILSLLALLVGLYLVFQALDGAVVRRREEIGILRSLGVKAGEIQQMWLAEAFMLGSLGGLVGTFLGWAGAQGAVRLVSETVNTLYHQTQAKSAALTWEDFAIGMTFGIGAGLLAGWLPAKSAALTPPAQILTRYAAPNVSRGLWQKVWIGPLLLLVALMLSFVPPLRFADGARFALAGYVAALLAVFGGGLAVGSLLKLGAFCLQFIGGRLVTFHLALSYLRKPSSRHRLAVAALLCAVAMTAGMATLVGSFDKTMRGWISRTFQADLYLASAGASGASSKNRLRDETVAAIAARPDIAELNGVRFLPIKLREGETLLTSGDFSFMKRHMNMAWMQKPLSEDIFQLERSENLCLVSESFSERFRKNRGDVVSIPTSGGEKKLTIAGVFSDYGNERGTITVDNEYFIRWFPNEPVSRLILNVKPGVDPEVVRADLREKYPGISVFTNVHLRSEVMRIFRQTFAITGALELIGVFVAVVGLGMTLASVLLERRNDLTTLRALGMKRGEMALAAAWEGVLLAVCGVVGGLVVSLGLGLLLVYVINKQTFGWTLQFALPWTQAAVLSVMVILSAAVVSYGVGRWGSGLPADREE